MPLSPGTRARRRAIWAGGSLPPLGAARDLLAHVIQARAAARPERRR